MYAVIQLDHCLVIQSCHVSEQFDPYYYFEVIQSDNHVVNQLCPVSKCMRHMYVPQV